MHKLQNYYLNMKDKIVLIIIVIVILDPIDNICAHQNHPKTSTFKIPHPWELFHYGDPTNPLYENDNTQELLKLCLTKSGNDAKTCTEDGVDGKCINDCDETRLSALIYAKDKVRGLINHLHNPLQVGVIWLIFILCCIGGIYLSIKGHYQWINLPLIGNWLMDDPTDGIKFGHYMWMKWIILGNSNIHWKTYMNRDSFVYNWLPLAKQAWERPPTPMDVKATEVSDRPPWTIDDILRGKGLHLSETEANGELDEGWENVVAGQRNNIIGGYSGHVTSEVKSGGGSSVKLSRTEREKTKKYQEVLDEYWERIYEWSWQRYRNIPDEDAFEKRLDSRLNRDLA